jgi:four helix bundle protein
MSRDGLEKLDVWRKSKALTLRCYREVILVLPPEEKFGLASQLRRSSQSIPANIAEGFGRYYFQDNIRFCYIARGSLEETISHLALVQDLGYVSPEMVSSIIKDADTLVQLINGYINYLKKSKQGANEPGSQKSIAGSFDDDALYDQQPDDLG